MIITIVRLLLALLSLRGIRWAFISFIFLGLLYFPMKVGFRFDSHPCELTFGFRLAVFSLTNFPHIILFALCSVLTSAQFRLSRWTDFLWAGLITIGIGALVELEEGATGQGHCRSRDLIPDTAGALCGLAVVLLLTRLGWKPRPTWALVLWRKT